MKPTLPKGTRDFLPLDIRKRDYIFNIIKNQFHLFGFDSIETPAMESLETLSGNYGDEGDRLLFKVLNNGDFLKDVPEEILGSKNSNKAITHLSKRGLRYDLTVPFARFIVMNRQHIKFPFKRSAIQPVWRADRPQRGRYQEFYQCDADVAGSSSLFYESELIRLYDEGFDQLSLPVTIRWNNRKILYGIAESAGLKDHFNLITIIIDKLDKIGNDGVVKELESQAFDSKDVSKLMEMISTTTLPELKAKMQSEQGHLGISEMERVLSFLDSNGLKNELLFDATLARGLGYYTGCIFEVKAKDANMGSIGGGGRYDNLTEIFGMKDVSGVGISFGVERIYDLIEEKKLFPESVLGSKNTLIACLDIDSFGYAIKIQNMLRKLNIACELYPEPVKLQKQMTYANELGYAHVAIIGEEESRQNKINLKDMKTGQQSLLSFTELAEIICQ